MGKLMNLLLVSAALQTVTAQNGTQAPAQHPVSKLIPLEGFSSLVTIDYQFYEEQVYSFINQKISETPLGKVNDLITMDEFFEFLDPSKMTYQQFVNVHETLDVNFKSIRHVMEQLNITALDLVNILEKVFNVDALSTAFRNFLKGLSLNDNSFYKPFFSDNATGMMDFFANGSYSVQNINKAFASINVTENEFIQAIKPMFLESLLKHNFSDIVSCVNSWPIDDGFTFLLNNFGSETSHLTKHPLVMKWSDLALNDLRNNGTILGIKVTEETIATHEKVFANVLAYDEAFRVIIKPHHSNLTIAAKDIKVPVNGITTLVTEKYNATHIPKPKDGDNLVLSNCSYIVMVNNSLFREEVFNITSTDQSLLIWKSNVSVFGRGSPLICNDVVYGLAHRQTPNRIYFAKFMTEPPVVQTSSSSRPAIFYAVIVATLLFVCHLY